MYYITIHLLMIKNNTLNTNLLLKLALMETNSTLPMETSPNFTYTTNPGGSVPLLTIRQRTALAKCNYDYKNMQESVFINLDANGMAKLVREILEKVCATVANIPAIWEKCNQTGSPLVLRSDVESESTVYVLGTHDLSLIQFSYFVEDSGDYEEGYSQNNVSEVNVFEINICGIESLVNETFKIFNEHKNGIEKTNKSALIRWYVPTSHGGLKDFNFQLKKDWDIQSSHYPWVKTELQKYYQAFADSRAQILVLYGSPGTGKTTFIRDMICELGMNSIISYDLKVITSDMTFVKYLSDKNFDAIIIEDADELLTAERGDYNKIISKILNVSDGLIKLPKKKLILTTNLEKLNDLDPAIIRPGRCFDVMEFRPFTNPEYTKVADEMGLVLTDEEKSQKKMTLAEVYSLREQRCNVDPLTTNHKIKVNKVGFL